MIGPLKNIFLRLPLQRSEILHTTTRNRNVVLELPGSDVHEQDFRGLPGEVNADVYDSTRQAVVFTPDENICSTVVVSGVDPPPPHFPEKVSPLIELSVGSGGGGHGS